MSEHNKPQSGYLIDALRMHHLPSDKPSQLADAFRNGFNYQQPRVDALEAQHQVMLDTLGDEMEKGFVLKSECKQFAAQAAENLLRANQMTEQHRMQCEMRKRLEADYQQVCAMHVNCDIECARLEAENAALRLNDARYEKLRAMATSERGMSEGLTHTAFDAEFDASLLEIHAEMEKTNDN